MCLRPSWTTMGNTIADQPPTTTGTRLAQVDVGVQDLQQITVATLQIGRITSPSATVLFGTDQLTVQVREIPEDARVWTALEWVVRARPLYITADELIAALIMRPMSKAEHEVRRQSMRDEVLSFGVRTLVIWARAYQLEEYFVDELHRPQSLLNADQFSLESADLRHDLQMSRRNFDARETHRATCQVGRISSHREALRSLSNEISKLVAIEDAPVSDSFGIRDALTCKSDSFEPDGCLAPAYYGAEAYSHDQVLRVGRMFVPKQAFLVVPPPPAADNLAQVGPGLPDVPPISPPPLCWHRHRRQGRRGVLGGSIGIYDPIPSSGQAGGVELVARRPQRTHHAMGRCVRGGWGPGPRRSCG